MGQFSKYAQPPPAPRQLPEGTDVYEPVGALVPKDPQTQGDPFTQMGGSIPMPYEYGAPRQQWNAEMMDRLMDTDIDTFDKDGHMIRERPKLWLFETKAFRHLQLTNLSRRDQSEIERDIMEIQMLAHQDGNDTLCDEIQTRVYGKIAMYKSRGDMPVPLRERDAWITNVNQIKSENIDKPAGNSGGFFSNLFGVRKDRY
jgi:hypothetical protein